MAKERGEHQRRDDQQLHSLQRPDRRRGQLRGVRFQRRRQRHQRQWDIDRAGAAGHHHSAIEPDRHPGPKCNLHCDGLRHHAAGLPVAAVWHQHCRRDNLDLHAHQRPTGRCRALFGRCFQWGGHCNQLRRRVDRAGSARHHAPALKPDNNPGPERDLHRGGLGQRASQLSMAVQRREHLRRDRIQLHPRQCPARGRRQLHGGGF